MGDNTNCEVDMLQPIRCQCVGVCTSTQLPRIHVHTCVDVCRLNSNMRKIDLRQSFRNVTIASVLRYIYSIKQPSQYTTPVISFLLQLEGMA